ncbi:MAG: hypothetical protein ACKVI4_15180, partial [Actinomycetales bacterium]
RRRDANGVVPGNPLGGRRVASVNTPDAQLERVSTITHRIRERKYMGLPPGFGADAALNARAEARWRKIKKRRSIAPAQRDGNPHWARQMVAGARGGYPVPDELFDYDSDDLDIVQLAA